MPDAIWVSAPNTMKKHQENWGPGKVSDFPESHHCEGWMQDLNSDWALIMTTDQGEKERRDIFFLRVLRKWSPYFILQRQNVYTSQG